MKKFVFVLIVVLLLCFACLPGSAADSYTLEDYNMVLSLPQGWFVVERYMATEENESAFFQPDMEYNTADALVFSGPETPVFSFNTFLIDSRFYGVYNLADASPEQLGQVSALFEEGFYQNAPSGAIRSTPVKLGGVLYIEMEYEKDGAHVGYATIRDGKPFLVAALPQEDGAVLSRSAREEFLGSIRYGENRYPFGILVTTLVMAGLFALMTLGAKGTRGALRDIRVSTKQYNSGQHIRGGMVYLVIFMVLMLVCIIPMLELGAGWIVLPAVYIAGFVLLGLKKRAFLAVYPACLAAGAFFCLYSFDYPLLIFLIISAGFTLWHLFFSRGALVYFRRYARLTVTDTGQTYTLPGKKTTPKAKRPAPRGHRADRPRQAAPAPPYVPPAVQHETPAKKVPFALEEQQAAPIPEERVASAREGRAAPVSEEHAAPMQEEQIVPAPQTEAAVPPRSPSAPEGPSLTQAPRYAKPDLSGPAVTPPPDEKTGGNV